MLLGQFAHGRTKIKETEPRGVFPTPERLLSRKDSWRCLNTISSDKLHFWSHTVYELSNQSRSNMKFTDFKNFLIILVDIFTARKRSLRRLCFYTCLSFCPQGGSASVHAGRPPPWEQTPPPGADPPRPGTPSREQVRIQGALGAQAPP